MDSRPEEANSTDATTTTASFPFNDTSADLILRSSDRVHFHVHKPLLSLASPVFRDMFGIGQAPQILPGIPVVQMSEDSDVLHKLLVWCDPRSVTLPGQFTFLDISRVLSLTDKFMMEGVTSRVAMLLLPKHVDMLPAHVYALAHRGRGSWGDGLMRAAAWQSLKSDFPHHTRVFDDIPAKALMRLYEYRIDCIIATQSLISNIRWIPRERPWQHHYHNTEECSCISLECNGGRSWVAKWFVSYLTRAADALKEKPCREAIFLDLDNRGIPVGGQQVAPTSYDGGTCSDCFDLSDGATRTAFSLFQQEFANEIDRLTKEVELIID
ncbi:hypothetical protein IW261DRAFT_1557706 [Armillaria novae-zelandiae]|uniref:BTB domain-containing protein n=1 Tax=Armillaria novae-zelandiae TaxID=153914 RepID=A0AA39PSF9_9AGAR|nr:hypothetical protein IW261DRAFT_1557706 [Armillaria novae-zelandiae]